LPALIAEWDLATTWRPFFNVRLAVPAASLSTETRITRRRAVAFPTVTDAGEDEAVVVVVLVGTVVVVCVLVGSVVEVGAVVDVGVVVVVVVVVVVLVVVVVEVVEVVDVVGAAVTVKLPCMVEAWTSHWYVHVPGVSVTEPENVPVPATSVLKTLPPPGSRRSKL
jgi:hypothetical protein